MWKTEDMTRFVLESNAIEYMEALSQDDILKALLAESDEGHVGALRYALDLARRGEFLNEEHLCRMHTLLMIEQGATTDIPTGIIGFYRDHSVCMPGGDIGKSAASVPYAMAELFAEFETFIAEGKLNTYTSSEFIADWHRRYEQIHPFSDGNGRTGRLVNCYMLAFLSLPIAILRSTQREYYFAAIRSEDSTLFVPMFRQSFVGRLHSA